MAQRSKTNLYFKNFIIDMKFEQFDGKYFSALHQLMLIQSWSSYGIT